MAKQKYSEFADALDAAATLDGTEPVVIIQDGLPVQTTTQDIADLGGAVVVEDKTSDFTANGANGTIYAMDGTSGNVVATLENSAIGTTYTFLAVVQDNLLKVRPATGHTIKYNDFSNSGITATDSVGINLVQTASVVTVLKTGATTWCAINSNLIEPETT